jgi:hypothetical protein
LPSLPPPPAAAHATEKIYLTNTWLFELSGASLVSSELELELIQTRMIQKPLLWVEVGKSACVLVGICELRLSVPARYGP